MVHYKESPDRLNATFAALADPTRRAILARLASGETSVTELAEPLEMSLPAVSKHLKVLERAGLIARGRDAQWRPCRLQARRSATSPPGSNTTAGSGRKASTAWTITCVSCRRRRKNAAEGSRTGAFDECGTESGTSTREQDMNAAGQSPASTADREIVLTRTFDAPRELVFDAWTDTKQIVQWWGPTGFTTTTDEMEEKPGGVWGFVMHGPEGTDYKNKIVFIEVVRPERLVYRHAGDAGTDPVRFHVTVTFAAQGSKTRLTMASIFETAEERNRVVEKYGAIEGGKQTLSRLAEHL